MFKKLTVCSKGFDEVERTSHCYPQSVSNGNNLQVYVQEGDQMHLRVAVPKIVP
jgi:hypothetical protein